MNVRVEIDDQIVLQNLENMSERLQTQLRILGPATAQKMQAFAQENAPWTDRTGNARARLKGSSQMDEYGLEISIYHQMDYGLYLEVCNNETFAILKKARDGVLPEFIDAVKRLRV